MNIPDHRAVVCDSVLQRSCCTTPPACPLSSEPEQQQQHYQIGMDENTHTLHIHATHMHNAHAHTTRMHAQTDARACTPHTHKHMCTYTRMNSLSMHTQMQPLRSYQLELP